MLKKVLIVLNICAIAILCLTLLTACYSNDDPVPSRYVGTYSDAVSGGTIVIDDGGKKVHGEIPLEECVIESNTATYTVTGDNFTFEDTYFDYTAAKKFTFRTKTTSENPPQRKGKANYAGQTHAIGSAERIDIHCADCAANTGTSVSKS